MRTLRLLLRVDRPTRAALIERAQVRVYLGGVLFALAIAVAIAIAAVGQATP